MEGKSLRGVWRERIGVIQRLRCWTGHFPNGALVQAVTQCRLAQSSLNGTHVGLSRTNSLAGLTMFVLEMAPVEDMSSVLSDTRPSPQQEDDGSLDGMLM